MRAASAAAAGPRSVRLDRPPPGILLEKEPPPKPLTWREIYDKLDLQPLWTHGSAVLLLLVALVLVRHFELDKNKRESLEWLKRFRELGRTQKEL